MQFLINLSKIILSQKNSSYYLIDADIISFFVASKGKKIQKIDENSENKEVKIHTFLNVDEFQWNFRKSVTYDDIESG